MNMKKFIAGSHYSVYEKDNLTNFAKKVIKHGNLSSSEMAQMIRWGIAEPEDVSKNNRTEEMWLATRFTDFNRVPKDELTDKIYMMLMKNNRTTHLDEYDDDVSYYTTTVMIDYVPLGIKSDKKFLDMYGRKGFMKIDKMSFELCMYYFDTQCGGNHKKIPFETNCDNDTRPIKILLEQMCKYPRGKSKEVFNFFKENVTDEETKKYIDEKYKQFIKK